MYRHLCCLTGGEFNLNTRTHTQCMNQFRRKSHPLITTLLLVLLPLFITIASSCRLHSFIPSIDTKIQLLPLATIASVRGSSHRLFHFSMYVRSRLSWLFSIVVTIAVRSASMNRLNNNIGSLDRHRKQLTLAASMTCDFGFTTAEGEQWTVCTMYLSNYDYGCRDALRKFAVCPMRSHHRRRRRRRIDKLCLWRSKKRLFIIMWLQLLLNYTQIKLFDFFEENNLFTIACKL